MYLCVGGGGVIRDADSKTLLSNRIFYNGRNTQSYAVHMIATSHRWVLSTWSVARVTEELSFNGFFFSDGHLTMLPRLTVHFWAQGILLAQPPK
jgi:hypothetical protein